MPSIRETVTEEIKTAMKAKDTARLGTLRMIKAELIKKETEAGAAEMDEQGMIAMLQTMRKQRLDAIAQFEKGGRQELADKERAEILVIESFLPEPWDDTALQKAVAEAATEAGAQSMKDMGKVIKAVRDTAAGRADGKRISEAVKGFLAGL